MHRYPRLLGVALAAILLSCFQSTASAQAWSEPVRGSWRLDEAGEGDVTLADEGRVAEIVVARDAHSAVRQAAEFLAGDIEKLSGLRPEIVPSPSGDAPATIRLVTLTEAGVDLPAAIDTGRLDGAWEAHQILTDGTDVWLVGSNARGTAFAAYTLSERLGIDPLYLWSGYVPQRSERLVMKRADHYVAPPTFRYRGLFHDDEDIMNRPFEYAGYPLRNGDIPLDWYKRYLETALRLRLICTYPIVPLLPRCSV